jgi:hypothetical protein
MKTIKITIGIKLILIAVIIIIGISLFSAFKQSEGSKKYLIMTVSSHNIFIIDEYGVVTEKKISSFMSNLKGSVDLAREINIISLKGYKLTTSSTVQANFGTYIFEKE